MRADMQSEDDTEMGEAKVAGMKNGGGLGIVNG